MIEDFAYAESAYIRNTAIVVTTLYDTKGRAAQITDFAPRFKSFGRMYRPPQIVRQIKPLKGQPRVTVRFRPTQGYGGTGCTPVRGTNHISYRCAAFPARLTTDVPISFVMREIPFLLEGEYTMVLGTDEPLAGAPKSLALEFFERTYQWWDDFSRALSVPFEWQSAVIRAAITLKLSQFEESGAIVAAHTTSIPEAESTPRTWDYRYSWLRDAFHTVRSLNRLSETRTMEKYVRFITNIVRQQDHELQPLYGILFETQVPERLLDTLPGYRGQGPVRVGNDAFIQRQNDNAGSVILAVSQVFVDSRITGVGTQDLYESLALLGERAYRDFETPDAGLWELRGSERVHTFSAVMCWVACHRMAFLSRVMQRSDAEAAAWDAKATVIKSAVMERAWDEEQRSFVATMDGTSNQMDAALLLLAEIQFIEATDPKFVSTVEAIGRKLLRGDVLMRYTEEDDFGAPKNAFNVCTFWYIDALASIGQCAEARRLFENMLAARNHVGILSEVRNHIASVSAARLHGVILLVPCDSMRPAMELVRILRCREWIQRRESCGETTRRRIHSVA